MASIYLFFFSYLIVLLCSIPVGLLSLIVGMRDRGLRHVSLARLLAVLGIIFLFAAPPALMFSTVLEKAPTIPIIRNYG